VPFVVTPRSDELPLVAFERSGPPINFKIVTGSPKGGSGKTSSMIFAASTLAAMGARVLIIEATEGQAPLTQAYHPGSFTHEDAGMNGLGAHLFQGLAVGRDDSTYDAAYSRYRPAMDRQAKKAIEGLTKISVGPNGPYMDFMACGEEALAKVQHSPNMQLRHQRRALLAAFLDAIAAAHPDFGWDFIFLDTLPAVESTVTRAAMGVADSYAVVVDVESSHPLTGWGAISEELVAIATAREQEGKSPDTFKGLILNKIGDPKKKPLVEKINRYLIKCERAIAEKNGLRVDILAEVPRLTTLTLLGFNYTAVLALQKRYGANFPSDLDDLTDDDIEAMYNFKAGTNGAQELLEPAAGPKWIAAHNPAQAKKLDYESQSLIPMLLALAGDEAALDAYGNAWATISATKVQEVQES